MGIASMVLGIVGLVFSFIPCLGTYGIFLTVPGLVLGAVFMATDYVTTPINAKGRMVFAFGCGLVTFAIRYWFAYPEGVSFSILVMNILTPLIEKLTRNKPLGGV